MDTVYVIRYTGDREPTGVYASIDAITQTLRRDYGEEPEWLDKNTIECASYEYVVTQHEVIN